MGGGVPDGAGDKDILDDVVVFISYAHDDGGAHVAELQRRLGAMPFPVEVRSDRVTTSTEEFARHLERQLRGCDLVLFVMTPASVVDSKWCRKELSRADSDGKDVVPLAFEEGLESEHPMVIQSFAALTLMGTHATAGWDQLEQRLLGRASVRHRLRERRLDEADLRRRIELTRNENVRRRLQNQLARVSREADELEARVTDTDAAQRAQQERIAEGQRFEQSGPRPPSDQGGRNTAEAPPRVPQSFTDREDEVRDLVRLVQDLDVRLIVLHGRDGIGKTAILDRLWQRFPDTPPGSRPVDLVYLSAVGVQPLTAGSVVRALDRQVVDQDGAPRPPGWLDAGSWVDRVSDVLDALGGRRVVLVLDAVDELLDDGFEFEDRDLVDVLDTVVRGSGHRVALLLATRRLPQPLLERAGDGAVLVPRTGGLPRERIGELLAALDGDPPVIGWRDVPEQTLHRLHDLTAGSPRAIELCHGILVADDGETPHGLVDLLDRSRPADSLDVLLGRAFTLLTHDELRIVQALAVFRKAVPASAVDQLLRDHLTGLDSRALLENLCEQRLVRREPGLRYALPAVPDGDYALTTLRRGTDADRLQNSAPLTRIGLLHRAADYWKDARPDDPITDVDGLRAQLNEIETRIRGEDYETAVRLMAEVDEGYLVGWGHSGALIPAYMRLLDVRGLPSVLRDKATFLLSHALFQQERFDDALARLESALRGRPRRRADVARVRLEIQMATALAHLDRLPAADRAFRRAARLAVTSGAGFLFPDALAGRAWCEGRQGRWRTARRCAGIARVWRRWKSGDGRQWLLANLLEAEGWVYGRLGERQLADRRFADGLDAARGCSDRHAEGRLLRAQAELAVEDGRFERARALAEESARLGTAMSGRALIRDAQVTIATARLSVGDLDGAARAAVIATRHRPSAEGLVMSGLIAWRLGDRDDARTAFGRAHVLAHGATASGTDFYQIYVDALALVGLTLCGDRDRATAALDAFVAGRAITAADGVVRRNVLLLGLFDEPDVVDRFVSAARGS